VRTIDWNVTARAGRPFVKNSPRNASSHSLLVDISASGISAPPPSASAISPPNSPASWHSPHPQQRQSSAYCFTPIASSATAAGKGPAPLLRVVRDILYHTPEGRGHRQVKALDCRQSRPAPPRHRVPEFRLPIARRPRRHRMALRRAMRLTKPAPRSHRRPGEDPREKELPNVGVLALEDAETGEVSRTRHATPRYASASRNSRRNAHDKWLTDSVPKASTPWN